MSLEKRDREFGSDIVEYITHKALTGEELDSIDFQLLIKYSGSQQLIHYLQSDQASSIRMQIDQMLSHEELAPLILETPLADLTTPEDLARALQANKDNLIKYCLGLQKRGLQEDAVLTLASLREIAMEYKNYSKLSDEEFDKINKLLQATTAQKQSISTTPPTSATHTEAVNNLIFKLRGRVNLQENLKLLKKYKIEAYARNDAVTLKIINEFLNSDPSINRAFTTNVIQSAPTKAKISQVRIPPINDRDVIHDLKNNGKLLTDESIATISFSPDEPVKMAGTYRIFHFPNSTTPYAIHSTALGAGAFGAVYRIQNLKTGEWSIIKMQNIRGSDLQKKHFTDIAYREHATLKAIGLAEGDQPLTIKKDSLGMVSQLKIKYGLV